LSGLLVVYGHALRDRTIRIFPALIAASWLVAIALRGYGMLRSTVAGLDYITLGLVLFGLAVLTSVAKGSSGRGVAKVREVPDASG
jgi:hypothetical protein